MKLLNEPVAIMDQVIEIKVYRKSKNDPWLLCMRTDKGIILINDIPLEDCSLLSKVTEKSVIEFFTNNKVVLKVETI